MCSAVDVDNVGDVGKCRSERNRLQTGTDIEIDGVRAGIGIRIIDCPAQGARTGVIGIRDAVSRQDRIEFGPGAEVRRKCRFDFAGGEFKRPVTSQCTGACQVCAGIDIRTSQLTKGPDKIAPGLVGSDIATIKKNVAILAQCIAPLRNRNSVAQQAPAVEVGIADLKRAILSMRNEVHRIQIPVQSKNLADLLNAILPGVEYDDFQ